MMICLDIICFKFRGQGHGSQFMEYVPFVGCGYSQLIKKQSGVGNISYSTVRENAQFQHGRGCAMCCCKRGQRHGSANLTELSESSTAPRNICCTFTCIDRSALM